MSSFLFQLPGSTAVAVQCSSSSSSNSYPRQSVVPEKQPSTFSSSGLGWGCGTYSSENAKLLQDWLASRGLPPQKLALERVDAGGRGLVAKTNIRKEERLLFVPASLIITKDAEWSDPQAGSIVKYAGSPEWPLLATYLISEASQGRESQWSTYISALPRQPESILLWSQQEVNKYLYATSIFAQALERISEVEDTYYNLCSSIYSKHPEIFPAKFFTLESFKWAFGILFSRLVRLKSLDEQVALVPWADMLNHSSQVNACLDFDNSSKAVILTTDQSYQPSEQVFISYGSKSKGELLLSYGFVPLDSTENDFVDLNVTLKLDDELFTAKQDALKKEGLSLCCKYPITIGGLPEQLIAFAHLAVCPPSMSSQISRMAAAASKTTAAYSGLKFFTYATSVDVDIQAYELILNTIEASLSKLSRFFESNGAASNDEKINLATGLCTAEQRILYRAQFVLRSKLRELRAQSASGSTGLLYGLKKLFK